MSATVTLTAPTPAFTPLSDLKKAHTQNIKGQSSANNESGKSSWSLDENGRFTDCPGDISEFLIPDHAGASTTTNALRWRAKKSYAAIATLGLALFYGSDSPRLRTVGISLLFPGAGYLAVGGFFGYSGFILTAAFFPLCMVAWFGAGGLAFPLADWIFSGLIATYFAGPQLVESSAATTLGLVGVVYTYLATRSSCEEVAEVEKKARRNDLLLEANKRWELETTTAGPPGSREMTLDQLRFMQWILELAMQDHDDYTNMTNIDQFQPAAFRYQLYEFVNCLGTYQCHCAPNFHGYLSAAQRNAIEKSITPKVLGFWRWESLWGKFTTNYDPVIKDNIMVTGFLALAIGIYQRNTGDTRYAKQNALDMKITDKKSYKHDYHSLYKALIDNWSESKFVLYPCEPNWIYSMCNLESYAGATVYEDIYPNERSQKFLQDFYRHFEEDFFTRGGSCIPIKSAITGFTIPGLCGSMADTSNSLFCSPFMPTLAKRIWLITKEENVRFDKDGKIDIINLKGADVIDGGNYEKNSRGPLGVFAITAAEWGDKKVSEACLKRIDEEFAPVEVNPKTGSKRNKGMGTTTSGMLTRARFMDGGDWATLVRHGPAKTALAGPVLDSAPYPQVLVAKAFSHTSKDLELVLYNGQEEGIFQLGLTKLQPGVTYTGLPGRAFTADGTGNAEISVALHGRTRIHLQPTAK
ncbi:uncharacterized protein BDZ99DRAFT_512419 [Mytilinidion resinicola]|uniref:Linalool dehydratase/isomerase domain-containing protein n=1 Tax=Mytilinidion resinicola TaxID=574789 RepID=A0A6A6Y2U0_9PEZI|nr:uncharacterized protein BDZ99DRAFT_512419 [Mytilinidion resinicola]KAF2802838.1 hypothetical protein BDZ99DRAFT_512419 [Mytilinidion resinicola]